jgi:biotin transport system substrate-specific component
MDVAAAIERGRYGAFAWRYERSAVQKLALAFLMATFTGLFAQIRVDLWFTPVPITGQTFAVLMSGVLLGRYWGGISQGLYAAIGIAGVPWFAGWTGGPAILSGPTGGYIVGFILAALFVGYFTDTFINSRRLFPMLGVMIFANFVLIHGPGLIWLNTHPYESWIKGLHTLGLGPYQGRGLMSLLMAGTIPFIVGDLIKIGMAAALVKGVTPKRAYNGEVDKATRWWIP